MRKKPQPKKRPRIYTNETNFTNEIDLIREIRFIRVNLWFSFIKVLSCYKSYSNVSEKS